MRSGPEECAAAPTAKTIKRTIASLVLFGIAFGYLEAAVVVYLRTIGEPIRASVGLPAGDLFPLTRVSQLGPYLRLVKIELVREAATLVMLAAMALAAEKKFHSRMAAFAVAFGVWDLVFYAVLKVLIGWPESLFTWDILFLLPVPWVAPVLAPVIVAASLTAGGILGLIRTPARVGWVPWMLLVLGGAIILATFTWDWRNLVSGGIPTRYPWGVFAVGELIGVLGFAHAITRSHWEKARA